MHCVTAHTSPCEQPLERQSLYVGADVGGGEGGGRLAQTCGVISWAQYWSGVILHACVGRLQGGPGRRVEVGESVERVRRTPQGNDDDSAHGCGRMGDQSRHVCTCGVSYLAYVVRL